MAEGQEQVQLTGTVERIIYTNEENGYTVCDVGTEGDNDVITACGIMPYIAEGDTLTMYGTWAHHPKYGQQFKVTTYEKKMPSDTGAILRYLSSRTIKGIGPVLAQKIVDEFGDSTLDVMENHPDWLEQVPGISRKKALEIGEDFKAKTGIRSAMMFFRDWFGAAMTVRIYKQYGSGAVDIAKATPYRLCDEVDGVGFERADQMAMSLGIDPSSEERLMSGVRYILTSNAAQNGHVCLPRVKLVPAAAKLLHTDTDRIEKAIDAQLKRGALVSRRFGGDELLYDKAQDKSEQSIADKLCLLDKLCPAINAGDVNVFIAREELETDIRYAAGQKKAIADALSHGVMILTGGPGTGKTTVVRALLHIFESMDLDVALCAPTGRASKRLSESTSSEAKTIHRLLEMGFDEGEDGKRGRGLFRRNEQDQLDEDVIIVDESSMVDSQLMCALLEAIKPGARLILIGDADQLPSVGAGRVLNDLIDSGRFATVRLDEIFRQAQESRIVTNAHAVNDGQMPVLTDKKNDFFFLPCRTDAEIAQTVANLYAVRLPRAYGKTTENGIQIITPSRKGEAGTDNLNMLLQAALNPPARGKTEMQYRETTFRVGDRVMQTRNNYDVEWMDADDGESGDRPLTLKQLFDKERDRDAKDEDARSRSAIFNGDIGVVTAIDLAEQTMNVRFDDRIVVCTREMLEDLDHAWAVTVHKSQGSEYPFVIIPMYAAPPVLLTRNLLYTAITRATRMVILVGREDIIGTMVENNRQTMRYTGLRQRLEGKA